MIGGPLIAGLVRTVPVIVTVFEIRVGDRSDPPAGERAHPFTPPQFLRGKQVLRLKVERGGSRSHAAVSRTLSMMAGVSDMRSYLPVAESQLDRGCLRPAVGPAAIAQTVTMASGLNRFARRNPWPTGVSAARAASAIGGDAGERVADGELVYLAGALVGQHRLEVAGVPQHRVLERDAGSAEHGAAGARDLDRFAH